MARKTYTDRISPDGGESLSPREAAFLQHYLADPHRNGTQAAIKAGYSANGAHVAANRLLRRATIRAQVEQADAKAAVVVEKAIEASVDQFLISKERILHELARMAFSDIRQVLTFGPTHRVIVDENGNRIFTSGVGIIPSDEISTDAAIAIEEVSEGPNGIKVKLASKRAALMDLAKLGGFYVEKQRIESDVGAALAAIVAGIQRSALPLTGANIITAGVTLDAQVVDADEVPDP